MESGEAPQREEEEQTPVGKGSGGGECRKLFRKKSLLIQTYGRKWELGLFRVPCEVHVLKAFDKTGHELGAERRAWSLPAVRLQWADWCLYG